ncbi:Hypothetical predicted protein, partial [Olea europaea subsp. europaea]
RIRFLVLQLYFIILCLFIALVNQLHVSSDADPLHYFTALQAVAVVFCFSRTTVDGGYWAL